VGLAALSLVACVRAYAAKEASVPEWVREASRQLVPRDFGEANAVVLVDETTYTVAADGQATERHRHAVKILRPQGRRDAGVQVWYDKDQKLVSLHVWSVGPDGHGYALKDSEIVDRSPFGQGNLYEEDRVKMAQAPGADPGGVVAYEYEQRTTRPYLTEKTWFFQDDLPHLAQSFTLELPPGFTYGTVWAHHAKTEAVDLEHQRYRWEMKDVPAVDLERVPLRPAAGSLEGRMTVHYAGPSLPDATVGSWESIGEWYGRLDRDRLVATPEIAAKAAELTAGKTDFYDRTEAVGEFVQRQIRYFGVELGIGGYQPHAAGDVYRNRYGDCKDKATLLTAMLGSVGVHAGLVMVDTERNVVDAEAPSIVGNHMIAAIEVPKGYESPKLRSVVTAKTGRRYLIFDPTWEHTPFGQLESNLQGGYGILMEGKDSQAIALPVLGPELNTIHRTAKFQLAADGTLAGTVTESRFGDVSEHGRRMFGEGDAKEQREYLDHMLERDFTAFKVAEMKVENAQSLNRELTLKYTVAAEGFARMAGPLMMVRPRVLGSEQLPVEHKVRTVPIDLRQTMEVKDEYEVALPPGYELDELPPPVKLDVGFAAYESASEMKDGTLRYRRTYTIRQIVLPAERYADLEKLARAIAFDEQGRAVLKKK
jgi:transglutaminase-like putative cysteine protease